MHNTIYNRFLAQARKTPQHLALVDSKTSLTYEEVANAVAQLASQIQLSSQEKSDAQDQNEDVVFVCLDRSCEMIIASLASLSVGRPSVAIDPRHPTSHKEFLLENAGGGLVITTRSHQNDFASLATEPLIYEQPNIKPLPNFSCVDLRPEVLRPEVLRPDVTSFLIYTSGSSGRPKGVELTQDAMLRTSDAVVLKLGITVQSHVLHYAAPAFDSAVLEWVLALTNGASLFLVPDDKRDDPRGLSDFLVEKKITQAILPSALLPYLPLSERYALEGLVVAGDVCPEKTLHNWAEKYRLFNGYGPTEITVCASLTLIKPGQSASIEDATANVRYRIEDKNGQESDEGELVLGGPQVALGYRNAPALTETAFYSDSSGTRWYRTGDLVRRIQGGEDGISGAKNKIIFVGRKDFQVKIRGNRVEPGAIEQLICTLDEVENAQILTPETRQGDKYLLAFLATKAPQKDIQDKVRNLIASSFPDYYMPTDFICLEHFPLTANGKIDRKALLSTHQKPGPVASSDLLLSLFHRELGHEKLGEDDDFFKMGGNSIALIRLLNAIKENFSCDISGKQFRKDPTAAAARRLLEQDIPAALPAVTVQTRPEHPFPLTPQQNAAWFLHQSNPDSKAYLAEASITFKGTFSPLALEKALNKIIQRHEIYRTIFIEQDGEALQEVKAAFKLKLEQVDCTTTAEEARPRKIARLFETALPGISDLGQLPLARFLLIRFADDLHVLLHQEHHIIHDGWSGSEFTNEMLNFYRSEVDPAFEYKPSPVPQYLDFAREQDQFLASDVAEEQLGFWRKQLEGCPNGVRLFGKKSQALGFEGASQRMIFTRDQWDRLEETCQTLGISTFCYTSAVLLLCLSRYSNQTDIAFGSAFANRNRGNSHAILGMLVNTIVLRQDLAKASTFEQLLLNTRQMIEDAQHNEEYPFGKIVAALNPEREGGSNPFFNVLLGFHDTPISATTPENLTWVKDETMESRSSKFDLDCLVVPRKGSFHAEDEVHFLWEYRSDIFTTQEITLFLESFKELFLGMLPSQKRSLQSLPVPSLAQQQKLLVWSQGKQESFVQNSLVSAISHRAKTRPEHCALINGQTRLTYAELEEAANELALKLSSLSLEPGAIVGLEHERGNALVIAMLAVWKAGATVLVLDQNLPRARLDYILTEARPQVILSATQEVHLIPENSSGSLNSFSSSAYIIFTSGSTGQPKGVVISHRSLLNLCHFHQDTFSLDEKSKGISIAHQSFDAYMAEVWPLLLAGGSVVSLDDSERNNLGLMADLFEQHAITHACLSTGLFETAMATDFLWPISLKTLLTGGDRLGAVTLPPDCGFRLFNMYGPTETTVDALCFEVCQSYETPPPVGHPITNASAYIISKGKTLCPVGVEGELLIGGAGVAQGYLGNTRLTEERFIDGAELFPAVEGRLYRTGDMARWNASGQIEFIGRQDDEIKIRGYRVDLSEITTRLQADEKVSQAACLYENGSLVAYVVPSEKEQKAISSGSIKPQKLARYLSGLLRKSLPDYMRPNAIMVLDSLPLTPQGKLDRRALPSPFIPTDTKAVAENPTEHKVTEIWQAVLDRQEISVLDNFFSIGGHSLLAIKIISRFRKDLGVTMKLEDFFTHFSIREQANFILAVNSLRNPSELEGNVVEEGSL
ncbi:non-ribosomal peptide synthetase [Kiloniella laminariae]|uniref:non-ribosomal peptide synthetase n=1 Tax=Kiloniella laminariae TaxID=454162 RepID=UPI00039B6608|nr:non-ribosomal peptide synthetase [Kiloniella laminariae]